MSEPTLEISDVDYNALPIHTSESLPPLESLENGFKCRNRGGDVCELVESKDFFASQCATLAPPKRGFRYWTPKIFVSKQTLNAKALERVRVAQEGVEKALEVLRHAQEDLAKIQ